MATTAATPSAFGETTAKSASPTSATAGPPSPSWPGPVRSNHVIKKRPTRKMMRDRSAGGRRRAQRPVERLLDVLMMYVQVQT